jgi:hypothetical protein
VIPFFETDEWWENPLIGQKKRLERDKFLALLESYYRLRGWDMARGRPTGAKLRALRLQDVADELEKMNLIAREADIHEEGQSPCAATSDQPA